MSAVEVNGASLETIQEGSGEPVVFVHGGISDHRVWEAQRQAIGQHYRAIAYSRRYHWPNAPIKTDAPYTIQEQVDDLLGLIKACDAAPAHVVGNSYGGLLSLLAALREPGLVRSLTLLEPAVMSLYVSTPPKPLELLKLAIRHPRTAFAIVRFGTKGIGPAVEAFERDDIDEGLQIFTRAVLGPRGIEHMTEARLAQAHDNLFREQMTGLDMPRLDPDKVRRLSMPILLLSGEQSPPVLRLLTDRLHEHLPHAERVDIPNASHDAQVDNPTAVTDALRSFLDRQGR